MNKLKDKVTLISVLRIVFGMSLVYAIIRGMLTLVSALTSTGILALAVANFVDTATDVLQKNGGKSEVYLSLILLLIVFGIFVNIGSVIKLVDIRIRTDINKKIKPKLISVQSSLEYKHIENDKSWEQISRVMRDPAIAILDGFVAYCTVIQIVVSIFSVLGLLWIHVWWSVVVIVMFSVPLFILSLCAGKKNYRSGQEAERFNRRTEYLDSVLSGRDNIEERVIFGYGDVIINRWSKQYEAGRKLQLRVSLKQFAAMKGASMMLALISLLIAVTLLNPVVSGELSIGLFTGIVSSIFGVINKIASQTSDSMEKISRNREYMKDLNLFLNLTKTQDALVKPEKKQMEFESLEFIDVRFRYPAGENDILKGMNFKLKKGKHYAIVGKNGEGKSTITKLITGLYPEYEGTILLNGRDIKSFRMSEIKAIFSVVYQDFAKFAVSLRDNIVLGDVAHMDDSRVDSLVEIAGMENLVKDLKYGLDTYLGKIHSEGQDISGGQWQKVAILRSLISQAPFRILDEPTSALDPISESKIYEEFEKLLSDKTTIFISHRLGSTKLADEILVVNDGIVAEKGTHEELMAMKAIYFDMYESQRSWYL